MTERQTHEIVTPISGQTIVCLDWINGREKQKIEGAMFKSIETSGTGTNMKPKMSETMIARQENAAIDAVVISIDGSSENIVDTVLDMRVKDFDFVLKHAQQIVDGDLDEKKETSSETNITVDSEQAKEESQTPVSA